VCVISKSPLILSKLKTIRVDSISFSKG